MILYTGGKTAIDKIAKEGLDRERKEREALKAQDPEFAAFQEMYDMCFGYAVPPTVGKNNATIPYDQCVRSMQQSVDKWCNLASYQKDKCETASMELGLLTTGVEMRNIFSGPP